MYLLSASSMRFSARLLLCSQSRAWNYCQKCKWSRAAGVDPQISALLLLQELTHVCPSRPISAAKRPANRTTISLNLAIDLRVDTPGAPEIHRLAQLNQQCRRKAQQI